MKREDIDSIIIHCSATKAGQDLRAKDIDRMHRARGFNQIGYNFVIDLDGTVENGRSLSIDGAHCNTKGFSGISYGEFYQFNLSSCIRQQNSLTAQFVSFSLSNLANIFYPPPNFYNN